MEAQTTHQLPMVETQETIKLTKNSRGYNWELKIFPSDSDKESLDRLESLNTEMMKRFGVLDND